MFITEYDEARTFAEQRAEGLEEGRAEGRAEGLQEGRAEGLQEGRAEGLQEGRAEGLQEGIAIGEEKGKMNAFISLVRDGILTISQAAEKVNMTVTEFEAAMNAV